MSLTTQLMEDMKQAMRDKDQLKLGVIRLLRSEIKNVEIDQGELDDSGVQKVVAKLVKQLKDALEDIKKAGREEIVAEEEQKITVLESYLPEQLSDTDLAAIVSRVVTESGETHQGKLTGLVMKEVAGKADGKRVAAAIGQALTQ